MDCISNIRKLAWVKFNEAECLFENGYCDWSYYTAGYTIELLLKAGVCKVLGIEDFYDENGEILKALKYPQTFKSHDFDQLLMLSGVYVRLRKEADADDLFKADWLTVCEWSEGSRYLTGKTQQNVQSFLILVKKIALWIEGQL